MTACQQAMPHHSTTGSCSCSCSSSRLGPLVQQLGCCLQGSSSLLTLHGRPDIAYMLVWADLSACCQHNAGQQPKYKYSAAAVLVPDRHAPHPVLCCAGWLNMIAPYILAPLYGVPPGTYRLHHVIMHHVEDNKHGWDLSATEGFQRDNLLHFFM